VKVGSLLVVPVRAVDVIVGALLADRLEIQAFTANEPRILGAPAGLADETGQRSDQETDARTVMCGLDSEATLRTVDNHVMALRRAIGDDPRRPRFLHTVRGEGYRLTLE
jgi:DNA-binding response OmpR family regulator